jgi:hypothetical protein
MGMPRAVLALLLLAALAAPLAAQSTPGPIRPRPPSPSARPETRPRPPTLDRDKPPVIRRQPAAAPKPPSDPMLVLAIEANKDFSLDLPNFICKQRVARSESLSMGLKWKQRDVVEAEVLIADEVESYRNITIDGKPTRAASMRDIGGTWSTGEYGAILWNLFAPESLAEFVPAGTETIRGRDTARYRYLIRQENSRWRLNINGRTYSPAHEGHVWVDTASGRALRIEMSALNFPFGYPLASAKILVEYDDIAVGERQYLLPLSADNTACMSETPSCKRNFIEFRDYRKFTADSSVFHTDSDVDFGGEPEEPEP